MEPGSTNGAMPARVARNSSTAARIFLGSATAGKQRRSWGKRSG
uniref:Uncharacterized protein n=1 Tax=Arundo donax TaxID=35708 RepID=A0A0A9ENZ6_ARUDO